LPGPRCRTPMISRPHWDKVRTVLDEVPTEDEKQAWLDRWIAISKDYHARRP